MSKGPFFVAVISLFVALSACSGPSQGPSTLRSGVWRMEMDLKGASLPFQFELSQDDSGSWAAVVHNGTEAIPVGDIAVHEDSFFLRMPLFDSEFKGIVQNDSTISGEWFNYLKGPEYRIPFIARSGDAHRFPGPSNGRGDYSGTWEVHFSRGTPDAYDAVGIFQESPEGHITGTFLTETGDYRFLEGIVHNDSLKLSCFDGSLAFLFNASMRGDSILGHFRSGNHWDEPWVAYRNPEYHLRNPDSLTFLREGYDMVDFRLPDLDGRLVSPLDGEFKGKALMIQIMGSWCPNCVDETSLLNELYGSYKESGLEVIAVAFEKHKDQERAMAGLRQFRKVLGVSYPILYGGTANKETIREKLPFLDHIMSYPTCIFVDRNGKVRRIRTGFYGPSTGQHYVTYKRNLNAFVEGLLAEPILATTKMAQK